MTSLALTLPSLRRSSRMVQRNLFVYKHTWMVIFTGFFEPIERDQDLQLVAPRVDRVRRRLPPGARGLERLFAGTRLQRDVDRALE